jgi:hypothetical protein
LYSIYRSKGEISPECKGCVRLVFSIAQSRKAKDIIETNPLVKDIKREKNKLMVSNVFALSREILKPVCLRSKQDAHLSWKCAITRPVLPLLPININKLPSSASSSSLTSPFQAQPIVFDLENNKKSETVAESNKKHKINDNLLINAKKPKYAKIIRGKGLKNSF